MRLLCLLSMIRNLVVELTCMDNGQIADIFSLLSKLMDISGENSFKAKSYSIAAFNIEKLPVQLSALPEEKIFGLKGIGDNIGKKVIEIMQTGELKALREYLSKIPPGVVEMLHIKGLGPKKIAVVWREMGIESIGELLYACNENRLLLYKGFGEKTQQNVKSYIEFYLNNQGNYLYAQVEAFALSLQKQLREIFPTHLSELTGAFKRHMETVDMIEWVSTIEPDDLEHFLGALHFAPEEKTPGYTSFKGEQNIRIRFYQATPQNFGTILFQTSSPGSFINDWEKRFPSATVFAAEQEVFAAAGLPYIEPYRRDAEDILSKILQQSNHDLPLTPNDVKGIIHTHSNWSDGVSNIEEMARAAQQEGFEYLVISDHSKSAFYANGLQEERIREQHAYIDTLNQQLAPFKIFKSIEADILNDGQLDYGAEILSSFDLIIASVHSNLKMSEEKAMMRLLTAIQNPYTTILGHMTGRLLLSREGYPVDHKKIIAACIENNVVIELNAHPRRLDIDWRWITYAVEQGALLSIDPDAHAIEGFKDIRYGVLAAQKAGLTAQHNLSSFNLAEFEQFLLAQKAKLTR